MKQSLNKVVFCDIDGVLNNDDYLSYCIETEGYDPILLDELDPRNIYNLKLILEATQAFLVCSSSWRWDKNAFQKANQQLKHFNIEFLDTTTLTIDTTLSRAIEINTYLEEHPEIKNYVILDDAVLSDKLQPYQVKTNFCFGLMRQDVNSAIQILNGENND